MSFKVHAKSRTGNTKHVLSERNKLASVALQPRAPLFMNMMTSQTRSLSSIHNNASSFSSGMHDYHIVKAEWLYIVHRYCVVVHVVCMVESFDQSS